MPGYKAPEATVGSASRSPVVLLRIAGTAYAAGTLKARRARALRTTSSRSRAGRVLEAVASAGLPDLPADAVIRTAIAWTQLFGLLGFGLFGQLANTFDPADALFGHAVDQTADTIGLPPTP